MRKIAVIISLSFLVAMPSFGGNTAPDVPDTWSQTLQTQTRQMMRSGIPHDQAIAMTQAMIQARFNQQQVLKAQEAVIHAHQKGLPTQPVINKDRKTHV